MADGAGYNKVYSWSADNSDPTYLKATFNVTFGEIYIHAFYFNSSGSWTNTQLLYDSTGETQVNKTVKLSRSSIYGGVTNKGAFVLFRIRMRNWYLFRNYYQVMTYGWYYPPYGGVGYVIPYTESYRYDSDTTNGIYQRSTVQGGLILASEYGTSAGNTIIGNHAQPILYNHVVWPETTSGYQV